MSLQECLKEKVLCLCDIPGVRLLDPFNMSGKLIARLCNLLKRHSSQPLSMPVLRASSRSGSSVPDFEMQKVHRTHIATIIKQDFIKKTGNQHKMNYRKQETHQRKHVTKQTTDVLRKSSQTRKHQGERKWLSRKNGVTKKQTTCHRTGTQHLAKMASLVPIFNASIS